jgi:hypothetical protein
VAGRRRETAVVVDARWGGSCGLGSEQRRAGVSVVMAEGAPHPFIVAREGHGRVRKGKQPTIMALTPLKVGWLDEGINGGLNRGIKAGE